MFLERHVYIYDPKKRYFDLTTLFKDLPGWHSVSDWEIDQETGYLRCYAGWNVMYDTYYFAALGTIIKNKQMSVAINELLYKNIGTHFNENGEEMEDSIKKIYAWPHPEQPTPPLLSCTLL